MRRLTRFFVIFMLMLVSVVSSGQQPAPPTHVLIISLDGARPDAILQTETPNIQRLAAMGAYSWTSQTVFPSATLPAHGSLLSGLSPQTHGYDDNVTRAEGEFEFPTVLTLAAEAGYNTAMITGKGPLRQFKTLDETLYLLGTAGDRTVVDGVIEALDADYNFIFAHFPMPDYIGHLSGWMSGAYLKQMERTDFEVGRLLAMYEDRDLLDNTLIILTADHGGHDTVHGSDSPEDMTIPWIMAGAGIQENLDLSAETLVLLDFAPTLLYLLELPVPETLEGRIVCEALVEPAPACLESE